MVTTAQKRDLCHRIARNGETGVECVDVGVDGRCVQMQHHVSIYDTTL